MARLSERGAPKGDEGDSQTPGARSIRILLVEDDPAVRTAVALYLEGRRYSVIQAETVREAERLFASESPEVVVSDYRLPDGNGFDVLTKLKAIDPSAAVVMLTGHGTIDLAVQALKAGAEHFLTKPVELAALDVLLARVAETQRNRKKQIARRSQDAREGADPFVGPSEATAALRSAALRIVHAERPILILGETGVGKGVLAKWLHANGPRADETLVDVNCAGLTRDFLETELFGHEKGAFTGASGAKVGLLEVAHRGTVFLDEIGDMDPQVQPKVLKVLEERRFRRMGDVRDRAVDIQLIGATHQDLQKLVKEGRFRNDLYYRISTLLLRVPSLRERREDIPHVARRILASVGPDLGRPEVQLGAEALKTLQAYPWPGNVREMKNVLERAVLLSETSVLGPGDLRFDAFEGTSPSTAASGSEQTLEDLERLKIETVLHEEGGHVLRAARRLGISKSSLYEKVKRLGLSAGRGTDREGNDVRDAADEPV